MVMTMLSLYEEQQEQARWVHWESLTSPSRCSVGRRSTVIPVVPLLVAYSARKSCIWLPKAQDSL